MPIYIAGGRLSGTAVNSFFIAERLNFAGEGIQPYFCDPYCLEFVRRTFNMVGTTKRFVSNQDCIKAIRMELTEVHTSLNNLKQLYEGKHGFYILNGLSNYLNEVKDVISGTNKNKGYHETCPLRMGRINQQTVWHEFYLRGSSGGRMTRFINGGITAFYYSDTAHTHGGYNYKLITDTNNRPILRGNAKIMKLPCPNDLPADWQF